MITDGQFTPEEALNILEMRIKDLSLFEDDPDIEAAFILTLRRVVMENDRLVGDRENNNHAMNLHKKMLDIITEKYEINVVEMDEFIDEAQRRIDVESKEEKQFTLLPPIERDEDGDAKSAIK